MIAVELALDALQRLAGVLTEKLEHLGPHVENFLRGDLDVRGSALGRPTPRLMHHDARMRQRAALAFPSRREKETTHARRHAHADRRHR